MVDMILILLLLGAAWVGYRRGLLGSLVGLLGNILALFLAYWSRDAVSQAIDQQYGTVNWIAGKIEGLLPIPDALANTATSMDGVGQLYSLLEQMHLPQGLKDNLIQGVQDQAANLTNGLFETMSYTLSHILAQSIWQGIVFILLWIILAGVIIWGSQLLIGLLHHIPLVGTIDRVGGALVSIFLVGLTVTVLYSAVGHLGLWENPLLEQSQILNTLQKLWFKG